MRPALLTFLVFAHTTLTAFEVGGVKIWGKVEAGPAYIHLDVIENKKTVDKMDLPAVRTDAIVIIGEGWNVRPTFMWGKNDGEFLAAGIAFGRCIPCGKKWIFTPLVGVTYTQVLTDIDLEFPDVGALNFKEKFESIAPWLGLEATFIITPSWRLTGVAQYAWSRSRTVIEDLFNSKSDSSGPNFGVQLEHDLSQKWSVNLGAGWNLSLSRDNSGIRGKGVKLGIARWF